MVELFFSDTLSNHCKTIFAFLARGECLAVRLLWCLFYSLFTFLYRFVPRQRLVFTLNAGVVVTKPIKAKETFSQVILNKIVCFFYFETADVPANKTSQQHRGRKIKILFTTNVVIFIKAVHCRKHYRSNTPSWWNKTSISVQIWHQTTMEWTVNGCRLVWTVQPLTWSEWSREWLVWWAGWSRTGCTSSSSVCLGRRFEQDSRGFL